MSAPAVLAPPPTHDAQDAPRSPPTNQSSQPIQPSLQNEEEEEDDDFAPHFGTMKTEGIRISEPPRKSKANLMNKVAYFNKSAYSSAFPDAQFEYYAELRFDPSPGLNKSKETNPGEPVNAELVVPQDRKDYHEKAAVFDDMALQYARKHRATLWPNDKNLTTPDLKRRHRRIIKQVGDNPPLMRGKMLPAHDKYGNPQKNATIMNRMINGREAEETTDVYDLKKGDRIMPIVQFRTFWASSDKFGVAIAVPQGWYKNAPGFTRRRLNPASRKRPAPTDDGPSHAKARMVEVPPPQPEATNAPEAGSGDEAEGSDVESENEYE